MKTILFRVLPAVLAVLIGLAVGHHLGRRNSIGVVQHTYLVHEAFYGEAKLSLEVLESLDSGTDQSIQELRRRAKCRLYVYCKEVEDLRQDEKYDWGLLHDGLYEQAIAYLESNPLENEIDTPSQTTERAR